MKAAILAAGLGTRLRPLTHIIPKALAPVLNRPLLGIILTRLEAAGCVQAAVNTHHLGEQVLHFLGTGGPWGLQVQVSHEPEILGTGGGLRNLARVLGQEPFLAVNADILTDLDFQDLYGRRDARALATLVLQDCPSFNNVWVDREGYLLGVGERPAGAAGPPLAYTGVQVVSPELLAWLPGEGPLDLVAAWRRAIAARERLATVTAAGHFWQDLGSREAYLTAHRRLLAGESPRLAGLLGPLTDPFVDRDARVGARVEMGGCVCLGRGVRVGEGAALKDTVVLEQAVIAPGVNLAGCVVAAGVRVTTSCRDAILI